MKIEVQRKEVLAVSCDLLLIPLFEGAKTLHTVLKSVNTQLKDLISTDMEDEGFVGKPGEALIIHTHHQLPAKRLLLLGMGKKEELNQDVIRRAAGRAVQAARTVHAKRLVVSVEAFTAKEISVASVAQVLVEGVRLSAYQFLKYKGTETAGELAKAQLQKFIIAEPNTKEVRAIEAGVAQGMLMSNATTYARDLINEPAIHMTPAKLAEHARHLAKIPGVKVTVYNEAAIRKMKMGALLAVAAGSDQPPYFIHLAYTPKKRAGKKPKKVVLCGKGITFDSGGISLKPVGFIEEMKMDMAGAATVLGIFSQIDKIAPNVALHGVIAATENMPSGKATKPGDVVTAYNGKTIEITNTDAEGRLVLADALAWAEEKLQPDYMVDIATLTGACMVALGLQVAGVFSTNRQLMGLVQEAARSAGEPVWELPMVDEYKKLLDSPIADLQNNNKARWGGAIEGALFLSHFVSKKTPWLHLDIAGPAWAYAQTDPCTPSGATGFSVRTLIRFLSTI
ncbi:MAG: leucyl aminopeptidase [Candidatus Kerfeldbacteria bacterium]|nr:leucyl aminopeptidase [Candidatus Kerfeldbacteria bacterium]